MVRVLLTGIGGPAGRSLNLQLQARGLEVVGTDMAVVDPPGAGFAQVPAARDDDFLDVLAEIVAAHDVDLVVPTVTEELVVIAAALADRGAYGVFGRRVPVVVAPHRAVAIADDKLATAEYLETAGLGVPVTFGGNGLAEMTEDDLASLGVPWLSKPRSGRGGRGVELHEGAATPADARTALRDRDIMQSFAPGDEYAPNLYVARDPRDDVVVVLRKTALAHGRHGNAAGVERTGDDVAARVAGLALDSARSLDLRGPVDVDVRLQEDGTPVVLEINARFGANSAHAPEVLDALLAEYLPGVGANARRGGPRCGSTSFA